MKIELTERWAISPKTLKWEATWHAVDLQCYQTSPRYGGPLYWSGYAWLGPNSNNARFGPWRKSRKRAQQDAEREAFNLIVDVRDSAALLVAQCGIDPEPQVPDEDEETDNG